MLPDFTNNSTGHIRTKTDSKDNNSDQILTMSNERFMIPEILMHPSDIGLDQAGIPEAITQSVLACDSCKIEILSPILIYLISYVKIYIYSDTRFIVCQYSTSGWQCQYTWISRKNVSEFSLYVYTYIFIFISSEHDLRKLVPSEFDIRIVTPTE